MQPQAVYGQPPPVQYQQNGYPPAQPVDSQYRTAIPIPNLSMGSAPVDCPSCGKRGMTRLEYTVGNTTQYVYSLGADSPVRNSLYYSATPANDMMISAWAAITFCFTGCLCFIPYMMNSLKDIRHNCGNCGVLLATWHKSGNVETHMHA